MGEAKKHRDAMQRVNDRSNREDVMHKRAQRAEGDLLKARAEIARLQAQVDRLTLENEELNGANIVNRAAIRMLQNKIQTGRALKK